MKSKGNPWIGLASYEENIGGSVSQYKFCGRDRAIDEMYSYVENNILTTLYGKSGVGKSSLLQAGLFPRLRANNYFPVFIRFGLDEDGRSYVSVLIARLKQELEKHGCSIAKTKHYADLPSQDDESFLWHFFHSHEFYGRNQQIIYPILVIDQFEEIFFHKREKLDILLKQLYLLVDDSSLDVTEVESADITNYRVIIAIREDDLFRFEDVIDRLRLVEMKYCRCRLAELTYEEASTVVSEPGAGLFKEGEKEEVIKTIVNESIGGDGVISTAVLSLICSMFYEKTIGIGRDKMSLSAIRYFMEGTQGNYLASFYNDIQKQLGDSDKWYYIEDNLVTDEGRRKTVLRSEFEKNVPDADFLFKGKTGMLRYVTTSSKREKNVEIIHDLLAKQLLNSKEERKIREKAKRTKYLVSIIAVCVIILSVFVDIISNKNEQLKVAHQETQTILARYLVSEANLSVERSEYNNAVKLLLQALPKDLDNPEKPYLVEAEAALHQVDLAIKGFNQIQMFMQATNAVYSNDGQSIIVSRKYSSAPNMVYDAKTYELNSLSIHSDEASNRYFFHERKSNNGLFEASHGHIYDRHYENLILGYYGLSKNVVFSEDSKRCLINHDEYIEIFDLNKGYTTNYREILSDSKFNTAVFSPCGEYVLASSYDGNAYVYHILYDKPVMILPHVENVTSAAFSPDGHSIVTVSEDRILRVWPFSTLQELLDEYSVKSATWE